MSDIQVSVDHLEAPDAVPDEDLEGPQELPAPEAEVTEHQKQRTVITFGDHGDDVSRAQSALGAHVSGIYDKRFQGFLDNLAVTEGRDLDVGQLDLAKVPGALLPPA